MGEPSACVAGEVRGFANRRIWRIAVNEITTLGFTNDLTKVGAPDLGIFQKRTKRRHFFLGKVWSVVSAKRDVKTPAAIVSAKAIVAVPIQIDEQAGTPIAVTRRVKLFPEPVVCLNTIISRREQRLAIAHEANRIGAK